MNDLISRQDFDKFLEDAEKEAVKNRKYVFASALNAIRGNLKNFPSAQPEKHTDERTETHACDLISRQAAIDALDGEITVAGRANAEAVRGYANLVYDRIKRLPSAQPEIIRCKDCKWKNNHNCTRAVEVWIDDNKYCAWAERREE